MRTMAPVDEQIAVLLSGVDYGDAGLQRQMESELRARLGEDRPLRVYLGIDPTATSLTLGHTVPLRKLRQFQDFGHHCIFLIGDYTALIGDPSDKNKLRPRLTREQIQANERTYFDQAARLLDPARTELRHNSEWLGALDFPAVIDLMSKFTVAEMLRRDNFRKRFGGIDIDIQVNDRRITVQTPVAESQIEQEEGLYRVQGFSMTVQGFRASEWTTKFITTSSDPIYLHEFLYALMQGYDAYALECDVQVGGTEQLFNLMAGRKIQEDAGQRPHVPVTMPILVGLDGKARMSKSAGNHIGVDDPPNDQYGKAMSLPDGAVMDFFVLATNVPRGELEGIAGLIERDPLAAKKRLGRTIVAEFYGAAAAHEAEAHFERTVSRREAPDVTEMPVHTLAASETLVDVLVNAGLAPSRREARRLVEQGAVSVDGEVTREATLQPAAGSVILAGKRRWLRLV